MHLTVFLFISSACRIKSIDLSNAQVDVYPLVQALKGNASLTSIDVRWIEGARSVYETMASLLLDAKSSSSLSFMRCDAFDMLETDQVLNLREEALEPSAVRLLAGLLKKNTTLHELDLTAADVEEKGAAAFASVMASNTSLTKLTLAFNPAIDEASTTLLRETAARDAPQLRLEL